MFNLDLNVRKQIRQIHTADTIKQMAWTLLNVTIMKNKKADELTRNAYVCSQTDMYFHSSINCNNPKGETT